jgi:hypothetical protein
LLTAQVALVYTNSIIAAPFSWFIVIIPALIFEIAVQVFAVIFIIKPVKEQLRNGSAFKKVSESLLILLIVIAPTAFLISTILLAVVGDYSIGIYYAFIPVIAIEVYASCILSAFVLISIFKCSTDFNLRKAERFTLFLWACVGLSFVFCQVMLCLTPWLKSYAWVSSLLPVALLCFASALSSFVFK